MQKVSVIGHMELVGAVQAGKVSGGENCNNKMPDRDIRAGSGLTLFRALRVVAVVTSQESYGFLT